MKPLQPIETKLTYSYLRHVGPRLESAGIKIEILPSSTPLSITPSPDIKDLEFFEATKRGLEDGLKLTFPEAEFSGKIIVLELESDQTNSSELSFLRGARALIASIPGLLAEK